MSRAPVDSAGRVRWRDLAAALTALLLAVAGLSYVIKNERRRSGNPAAEPIDFTPYITGASIGLLFAGSLVILGHPVGASGAIQNLAGWVGHRMTPATRYWEGTIPIGVTWQVFVIFGVVLGSLASAALGGRLRLRTLPEHGWIEAFGPSRPRRFALAFVSAALLEYAAAIAGGCTSGLALSGGIVLAPAAYLFMIAMFIAGIPTAWLIGRRIRGSEVAP